MKKGTEAIAIVGPGALGSLFAALLWRAGRRVVLVDHRPDRAGRLNGSGIKVEFPDRDGGQVAGFTARPEVVTWQDLGSLGQDERFGAVFVLVKAHQTAAIVEQLGKILAPSGLLISLQNGIGHQDLLSQAAPASDIVLGVALLGANKPREDLVRLAGAGKVIMGFAFGGGADRRLRLLGQCLEEAGFQVELAEDIHEFLWEKLFVNVGINAITALCGIRNGQILEISGAQRIMEAAVEEAWQVYVASGRDRHELGHVLMRVREVCRATGANISSMLQDRKACRATEIEFINGAVCGLAGRYGVKTPVNATLCDLVRVCQEVSWKVA